MKAAQVERSYFLNSLTGAHHLTQSQKDVNSVVKHARGEIMNIRDKNGVYYRRRAI
jgi:hypothetical protein